MLCMSAWTHVDESMSPTDEKPGIAAYHFCLASSYGVYSQYYFSGHRAVNVYEDVDCDDWFGMNVCVVSILILY